MFTCSVEYDVNPWAPFHISHAVEVSQRQERSAHGLYRGVGDAQGLVGHDTLREAGNALV